MLIALTAVLTAGFYAANVPIKLAFCAQAGGGMKAALGAAIFEGRFALRSAEKKLFEGAGKMPKMPKKVPLRALFRLLGHVRLEYLRTELDLGLSDAAGTAIAVGCLSALLAAVRAATGARVIARIRPDFQNTRLSGRVAGIVTLTAGHIMLAALLGAIEISGRNRHGEAPD